MTSEKIAVELNEIMQMIPHRWPFLLIDRVKNIIPGRSGTGVKAISYNEPFFQGHFPERPILPGVLIVESMAQTIAIVMRAGEQVKIGINPSIGYLARCDVKFTQTVKPGCLLNLEVAKLSTSDANRFAQFHVRAFVDSETVAEGRISITY